MIAPVPTQGPLALANHKQTAVTSIQGLFNLQVLAAESHQFIQRGGCVKSRSLLNRMASLSLSNPVRYYRTTTFFLGDLDGAVLLLARTVGSLSCDPTAITSGKSFSERIRELEVGNPGVGTPLDLIQQFYGLDATIHGFEQQR